MMYLPANGQGSFPGTWTLLCAIEVTLRDTGKTDCVKNNHKAHQTANCVHTSLGLDLFCINNDIFINWSYIPEPGKSKMATPLYFNG